MNDIAANVTETHVSYVFFVGDRAYKLKKPVRTDFLDYSTREARERICHREVELNRRLAPDVYLGVADVLDPEGDPCDHLVVMRRMPPDRRLTSLVSNDAGDAGDCLRAVARTLAALHASADRSPEIASAGRPEAVLRNWRDNHEQMERYRGKVLDPDVLDRVWELADRFIGGRRPLLEKRISERRIVDGHGDVLTEDIFCLEDGPRILDCIEFDDRLRYGDAVADAAFLAMDLERLGRGDLSTEFVRLYREFSAETCPESLVDHYVAYRGQVRSKVACLRAEQGDRGSVDEAQRLLEIARSRLERGQIRLMLVGGPPGTGKSTLAAGLADRLGFSLLRSDEIRQELADMTPGGPSGSAFGESMYHPEVTQAVYETLLARAEHLLGLGESVVLDASWNSDHHRTLAVRVADRTVSDLTQVRCTLDPSTAAERIRRRAAAGGDPSEATPEVAAAMRRQRDPWPAAVPIETDDAPEIVLERVLRNLRRDDQGRRYPD